MSATILIVEDDPDIREIMEYNLSREGLRITCTEDGKDGLRLAYGAWPCRIKSDIVISTR